MNLIITTSSTSTPPYWQPRLLPSQRLPYWMRFIKTYWDLKHDNGLFFSCSVRSQFVDFTFFGADVYVRVETDCNTTQLFQCLNVAAFFNMP